MGLVESLEKRVRRKWTEKSIQTQTIRFSDGKAAKDAGRLFMRDMEKLGKFIVKQLKEMGIF